MNGTLERIEEADAEVDGAVGRDLRVGAADADCWDTGFFEDLAASHGDAGAIGAEDDGNAAVDQLGSCRRTVFSGRAVVDDLKLDVVGLAADFDGRLDIVAVLRSKRLLLTAGAVVAGQRLEDTNLEDLVAGLGRRSLGRGGRGGRGFRGLLFGRGRTGAANEQASQHAEAKKQCDGLFHET